MWVCATPYLAGYSPVLLMVEYWAISLLSLVSLSSDYSLVISYFSVLRIMGSRRIPSSLSLFQPYLIILALVDTFLIFMYLLDNVFIDHIDMSNTYWYYTVVPYITHPIKSISITMSMLWVVIIAIERFLAVTQPLTNRDKGGVRSYAIFLGVFSVTVNLSK